MTQRTEHPTAPPTMTLRDYFAGQALAGYMVETVDCTPGTPELTAEAVYKIADAMLAKRAKDLVEADAQTRRAIGDLDPDPGLSALGFDLEAES